VKAFLSSIYNIYMVCIWTTVISQYIN